MAGPNFWQSFSISPWKGNYCRVAHMASDCSTATLLYELLVDHPRLSQFFGRSFPSSKNLNLLLNRVLSCCWWAEWFLLFYGPFSLALSHLLCFPEEGLHLLQIDQMLSKHTYIFYALHVRKWNTGRRNVVCGDRKKVLVTCGNRNHPYIWPDIIACWKKMTPSFVCVVFLEKTGTLLLFNNSIFRVCYSPQWLQLGDPDYCSLWSLPLAMILWLNLLSCASFRYIFCF